MDYEIFNKCTDVNACDCTQGCTDTLRESALKVDPGRKIPGCTGESNLHQRHASLMLYQLSYIPIDPCKVFSGLLLCSVQSSQPRFRCTLVPGWWRHKLLNHGFWQKSSVHKNFHPASLLREVKSLTWTLWCKPISSSLHVHDPFIKDHPPSKTTQVSSTPYVSG